MKKTYLLFGMMFFGLFLMAQEYTSKYNATHGIIKDNSPAQANTQPKDALVTFFSEDFEGGDLATAGWTALDVDGDTYFWEFWCTSTTTHGGTCALVSQSWDGAPLTPNNYAITPQINLTTASGTVFLEWYVRAQDQTWPSEHYDVKISTTGTAAANFTTQLFHETVLAAGPELNLYWKRTVDLSAYAGQNVYIAFIHTNCTDMFRINIDDVSVYENTITDAGITDVVAPNNGSSCSLGAAEPVTITIFNYGGAAITGFPVTYSINGGTPVTETVSSSIAPATSYDYTFTQTADVSALGYYTISANVNLTADSDGSNNNYADVFSNTDSYIDVAVNSDDQGGQSWEILNTSNDVIGVHGAYQWNITESTRVCVIDNDCYTFNWFGGTSNTVTISYNGVQQNQTVATGDYSVYAIGGNCLALDATLASLTFPNYTLPSTNVNITGTVQNIGTTNITSYSVSYTIDGGASVGTFNVTGINLATGGTHNFTHDVPFNTAVEATYNIEVTILNVNGGTDGNTANNVLSKAILVTSSLMQRLVVWEEFSTESCPNCPPVMDAILAYEATQANMIMMTHHSGYYTDFLTIPESEDPGMMEFYNDGGGSYAPAGMADRYYNGLDNDGDGTDDPGPVFWPGSGYGETAIDTRVAEPAFVSVLLNGSYNSSTNALNLTVSGNFLTTFTGSYGVSVWICQNNIQESATGQSGATTSPWIHQHSVRDVLSGVWGDQITTPTTAGSNYSKTYNFTVPGAWVEADCYIVAFVNKINAANVNDRDIQNAGTVELLNIVTGNQEYILENNIHIYPNPTSGLIKFLNVENATIDIYNTLGEVVTSVNSNTSYQQIDLSTFDNGTYIVKIVNEGNVITRKIVLEK
ncbi:MAG: choice-of-anchor J domain-containing protein [Bacteroidota bacterium]